MVILSGTNRPGSMTRRVAKAAEAKMLEIGVSPQFLDLLELPHEVFDPAAYTTKPAGFAPFQKAILEADGMLIVTPEYNGSFPGALKYFIDLLKFPQSLQGVPIAFIGVSAGHFGAVRSVEQLAAIVQFRSAHLFGQRLFLHGSIILNPEGKLLGSEENQPRFEKLIEQFVTFAAALRR